MRRSSEIHVHVSCPKINSFIVHSVWSKAGNQKFELTLGLIDTLICFNEHFFYRDVVCVSGVVVVVVVVAVVVVITQST